MTKEISRRKGTTAEHAVFAGGEAEITIDTTKNTVVVQDGVTLGGFPLAREDLMNARVFTGATDIADGLSGIVPVAPIADRNKVLGADGSWKELTAGPKGDQGDAGPSAYDVAVTNGFEGTEAEWLASLQGAPGTPGAAGEAGEAGTPGTPGATGADGLSAYQVAVAAGFEGDTDEWLLSLKGEQGPAGTPGAPGEQGPAGTTTWAGITDKPSWTETTGTAGQVLTSTGASTAPIWSEPTGGDIKILRDVSEDTVEIGVAPGLGFMRYNPGTSGEVLLEIDDEGISLNSTALKFNSSSYSFATKTNANSYTQSLVMPNALNTFELKSICSLEYENSSVINSEDGVLFISSFVGPDRNTDLRSYIEISPNVITFSIPPAGTINFGDFSDGSGMTRMQYNGDDNIVRFDQGIQIGVLSPEYILPHDATDAIAGSTMVLGDNAQMVWQSPGVEILTNNGNMLLTPTFANKYVRMTSPSAKSITVQSNATAALPIGTTVSGISVGGQLEFVAASGVTINTPESLVLRDKSFVSFVLTKVGVNEWDLAGDLELV